MLKQGTENKFEPRYYQDSVFRVRVLEVADHSRSGDALRVVKSVITAVTF